MSRKSNERKESEVAKLSTKCQKSRKKNGGIDKFMEWSD